MKLNKDFVKYLIEENFIENFNNGVSDYYRLSTECNWIFNSSIVDQQKKEYLPGEEKGGIFYIKPSKNNTRIVYEVKECRFIKNTAKEPSWQYRPDQNELAEAREHAMKHDLLPINFHTHPIFSENILFESMNYYLNMDTSDADKKYRYLEGVQISDIALRLPDVLVIGEGTVKKGLFIGIYGGLIAPLDFTDRKNELVSSMYEKGLESITDYFDTPQKKYWGTIGGIAAGLGLLFLFVKYPKAIPLTLISTASVIPMIAYSTSDSNLFFGISYGMSLDITLPRLSDEIIRSNEQKIIKLLEQSTKNNK